MDGDLLMIVVLGGAMAGGWWFWKVFDPDKRLRERIADAPKAAIAAAKVGEAARFTGIAKAIGEPIAAPLSKRACVYYRVWIVEHVEGRHPYSETRITDEGGEAFDIEDTTGRARVDPAGAELALDTDWRFESRSPEEMPAELREYLRAHDPKNKWARRTLRWKEAIVGVDEEIEVLGVPARDGDKVRIAGPGLVISDGRLES